MIVVTTHTNTDTNATVNHLLLADGAHGVVQAPTVAAARGGEILCPLNK